MLNNKHIAITELELLRTHKEELYDMVNYREFKGNWIDMRSEKKVKTLTREFCTKYGITAFGLSNFEGNQFTQHYTKDEVSGISVDGGGRSWYDPSKGTDFKFITNDSKLKTLANIDKAIDKRLKIVNDIINEKVAKEISEAKAEAKSQKLWKELLGKDAALFTFSAYGIESKHIGIVSTGSSSHILLEGKYTTKRDIEKTKKSILESIPKVKEALRKKVADIEATLKEVA